MATRVWGSGTWTPTRVWGSGTAKAATSAEYAASLANLQGDTTDYRVTKATSSTKTITFTFDGPATGLADPAAAYAMALVRIQSQPTVYTVTGQNPTTRTITFMFDNNTGIL